MDLVRIVLVAAVILSGIGIIYKLTPSKSILQINQSDTQFPIVTGYNLDRQELEFPRDFSGVVNLVFIPFQRNHQDIVDTWIPTIQQIEADFPGFIYYELPTLHSMSTLYRTFLNEGMRAGIPDSTSRQRTVTLYLDKERFKSALNIPSEGDIYLFLVNQQGEILWTTTGGYAQEKANQLVQYLQESALLSQEKTR